MMRARTALIVTLAIALVCIASAQITLTTGQSNETISLETLQGLNLLEVTLDKEAYNFGDTMTITVKNLSDNTVTFGSTAYGVYFEKWENEEWIFYTGVGGEEVITYLQPGENHQVTYSLYGYYRSYKDNRWEYYFSEGGRYRAISEGAVSEDVTVYGYAEFTVNLAQAGLSTIYILSVFVIVLAIVIISVVLVKIRFFKK